MNHCCNFPKDLDTSNCNDLTAQGCDFKKVNEFKFKRGAVLDFEGSCNFPPILDFSECAEINLQDCDFRGVKVVKVKNWEHAEHIKDMVDNFKGKIISPVKKNRHFGGWTMD